MIDKKKELPKSFACRNTNQDLWDKYIKWLNTTYSRAIYGDSDVYPYYGITTNGDYSYRTSIDFYDTILTLEEWDEIVNPKSKQLPKSFACTNTNQELWDKFIKWLNKEHDKGFGGHSSYCPYYGIGTDELADNFSSKHNFDTILTLEEWDEIVNGTQTKKEKVMIDKKNELPKSFACRNTNQKLWGKYIKWLNKEHNKNFDGNSSSCWYYGINKNEVADNHSSKHDFDTILSLEEWNEIVNKTQTKTEKVMKKYEITRAQLKEIHDIACDSWKCKIQTYTLRNPFGNTFEFTQTEVDEMFKAATANQMPVLEGIFGKQTREIDLSTGFVDGNGLFNSNGELTNALMCVRLGGKYANEAFVLNNDYDWEILKDVHGQLCLVPTRK